MQGMKTNHSPRIGRPPLEAEAMLDPIVVRLPKPLVREIEAIMASRADQPKKGQVIRELLAAGLAAKKVA